MAHSQPIARATDMTLQQIRCGCGSLLARRAGDTIELKCRRCRRHVFLRLLADGGVEVHEHPPSQASG